MVTAGLRELRQNASDLVRQAEAGEIVTVTVSGRPVAQLVGVAHDVWRRWSEVDDIFDGPPDPDWSADRDRVDDSLADPFAR